MKIFQFGFLIPATAAVLLGSCQYKDFDDYAGTVPVKVIADYGSLRKDSVPKATRCVFYSFSGDGEPVVCDVCDSSTAHLADGAYYAFAYNNESQINRTRAYDYLKGSPLIYTDKANNRGVFKKDSLDNTTYYDYPDVTYTYYNIMNVIGQPFEENVGDKNSVRLQMKKVTKRINIIITGIKNTSYIQSFRVAIDNMQREYSPQDNYSYSYVSLIGDGVVDENDTLRCSMNTFGIGNGHHVLTLMIDGGNFNKVMQYDVSDEMDAQRDGNDISISVMRPYDLKDDVPVQNSFNPKFEDWNDNPIPVDM